MFSIGVYAQTNSIEEPLVNPKHEIKANALFLALGVFEAGYEYLINDNSSLGLVATVPLRGDVDLNFGLEGYCRVFFGKKYAAGFFLEGFAFLNNTNYESIAPKVLPKNNYTDVAFGVGLGSKWVTNSGLIIELNAGVGRQMFRPAPPDIGSEFIAKVGVTLGYRF